MVDPKSPFPSLSMKRLGGAAIPAPLKHRRPPGRGRRRVAGLGRVCRPCLQPRLLLPRRREGEERVLVQQALAEAVEELPGGVEDEGADEDGGDLWGGVR
jgi:hypothetical protein